MTMGPVSIEKLPHEFIDKDGHETIVRALAAKDPNVFVTGTSHECGLCRECCPAFVDDHEPDCPWRLAVEWVAEH